MEPLFEGLTISEIEYLQYLNGHGYFDGFEMDINSDTSSNYRVEKFEKNGYITLSELGPHPGSFNVTLTGKGIAAIVDYEKYQSQIQPLCAEIDALNKIADSLKRQTILAEEAAKSATIDAKNSKNIAIASIVFTIIIGICEIILPLIL